jgi:hypothetical protein
MDIQEIVDERGISEIVHFTSNHGLVGMLELKKALSRRQLPENDHLAYLAGPTSAQRQEASEFFDKQEDWLDFLNLSISEINYHYFNYAATKWHNQGDRWWAILVFSPEILSHENVFFATTNNVYIEHVKRGRGADGLNQLFVPVVKRKGVWFANRGSRPSHLPTCQQAEVLYPQSLPLTYLRKIYVRTDEEHDIVAGWLRMYGMRDVQVKIEPEKFRGVPN